MEQEKAPQTPMELLSQYANAPSQSKVQAWKAQAPANRIRLAPLPPDGTRAFLLRAFSGLELADVMKAVPSNSLNQEYEAKLRLVSRCILWSSEKGEIPYDELELRATTAGLVESLHALIQNLSDYYDPMFLMNIAVDF